MTEQKLCKCGLPKGKLGHPEGGCLPRKHRAKRWQQILKLRLEEQELDALGQS